ncbi:bacterial regulatory, tetR family protein [Ochrobactrum quorumnocens]|uniref:Bacterial regulatory, tetR family protein n=1 Tax=Ochrobactrum quorumnocens TaxID=271865 RepID=A0A248UDT1_9HYPH|nr:TetR/AcrR family transcriptional regulator [[Ochrobactrum] quorumnocens]ASV84826.1 bacterial regulatory, tetR family protein [[Ochrobactrum] quorumnocens]
MSQRADGRENRLRLIEAAEAIFANEGFDVPLEAIAKSAGVSRMTFYRHFQDRESLCFAIFERNIVKLEEMATRLQSDPNAFALLLDALADMFASDYGLVEGLTRQQTHQDQLNSLRQRVVELLSAPLVRARDFGLIKDDFQLNDLYILIDMLGAAVGVGSIEARRARVSRALMISTSGFTPPPTTPTFIPSSPADGATNETKL